MPKSARKRLSRKLKTKKGGKKRSRKLKYIKKRKQSGGDSKPSGELTNIWCLGKYGEIQIFIIILVFYYNTNIIIKKMLKNLDILCWMEVHTNCF